MIFKQIPSSRVSSTYTVATFFFFFLSFLFTVFGQIQGNSVHALMHSISQNMRVRDSLVINVFFSSFRRLWDRFLSLISWDLLYSAEYKVQKGKLVCHSKGVVTLKENFMKKNLEKPCINQYYIQCLIYFRTNKVQSLIYYKNQNPSIMQYLLVSFSSLCNMLVIFGNGKSILLFHY